MNNNISIIGTTSLTGRLMGDNNEAFVGTLNGDTSESINGKLMSDNSESLLGSLISDDSEALIGKLMSNMIRGYSAYEVAVREGYVGTVEEWLASLVGESVVVNVIRDDENAFIVEFSVGDVVVRTPNLRENLIEMKQQISNMQTQVTNHNTEINNLHTTDNTLQSQVSTLNTSLSGLSGDVESIGSNVSDINRLIGTIPKTAAATTIVDYAEELVDGINKVEPSQTNGNIKINDTETTVYTHPGSGTNPHGTTKSDVGLSNVGNYKAVSTVANQGLSSAEKTNARENIGAGTSSFSGSYNDLTNKPTLGTVADKNVASSGNASTSQVVMGNDTRLSDSRNAKDVYSWAKASTKPSYTASEVGAIATTDKGAASGVAELDSSGKVPSSQLPSSVDDVLEYASISNFPATGEVGKIYIDTTTNLIYRWNVTEYVKISSPLVLGETSSTAYRGDRGKIAYDHSQSTHARTDATKTEASSTNGNIKINGTETTVYTHPSGTNPHGTTKSDVGLGNVGNFKAVSTVASQDLTSTEQSNARANIGAGTSSFSGSYSDLSDKPTLGTASAKDVASSGNASATQVVMGNDTRLTDDRNAKDVYSWAKASTKPSYTASEVGAIATTEKGAASGVAELDENGLVPSSQLPSFVDDVIEADGISSFPTIGEVGKIYVDVSTNKTYRWGGSSYTEISASLALGENSSTAYRGDRGKTAYDHSQSTHARTDATAVTASNTNGNIIINGTETTVYTHPSGTNPHGTTKSDVGLGNVGNFKAVSTEASQGLSTTEQANARANIGAGISSFSGSYTDLSNKPTLGTAAAKDVASSGNASTSQVVMGNDTRLSDARPASDVSSWAKASTKPTYTASEVGLGNVGNFKAVSTEANQDLTDTEKSNARTNIGAGTSSLTLGTGSENAYRGDYGNTAYTHSQSAHARTDATKTEASATNGNIKIDGTETTVYTHPGSGTNPHGTTKSDVGLGNVGNYKAVSTVASQGLTDTEKSNARANIDAGTSSFSGSYDDLTDKPTLFSGSYNDLSNKPTIPTLSDAVDSTSSTVAASSKAVKVAYDLADSKSDTHRPVQVNDTEILGNNTTPLNLKAGSNMTIANNNGTVTFSADTGSLPSVNDCTVTFSSGSGGLPSVTVNDNGKILQVVNGSWEMVPVFMAEGGNF